MNRPTRASRMFLVVCALAAGCGASHGPDISDGGAPIDAPMRDATPYVEPPAALELALIDPSFAFCHCHHGFGPGADGTLTLRVQNGRASPIEVRALLLRLVAVAGDNEVATWEGDPPGGLRFTGPGPGPATKSVPAATELDIGTVAYIDCAEENLLPGSYRVELDLAIDGVPVRMISSPIDVPMIL